MEESPGQSVVVRDGAALGDRNAGLALRLSRKQIALSGAQRAVVCGEDYDAVHGQPNAAPVERRGHLSGELEVDFPSGGRDGGGIEDREFSALLEPLHESRPACRRDVFGGDDRDDRQLGGQVCFNCRLPQNRLGGEFGQLLKSHLPAGPGFPKTGLIEAAGFARGIAKTENRHWIIAARIILQPLEEGHRSFGQPGQRLHFGTCRRRGRLRPRLRACLFGQRLNGFQPIRRIGATLCERGLDRRRSRLDDRHGERKTIRRCPADMTADEVSHRWKFGHLPGVGRHGEVSLQITLAQDQPDLPPLQRRNALSLQRQFHKIR